ncbi:hypothetical protein pb186bvf_000841 [Paramecium bursaria]
MNSTQVNRDTIMVRSFDAQTQYLALNIENGDVQVQVMQKKEQIIQGGGRFKDRLLLIDRAIQGGFMRVERTIGGQIIITILIGALTLLLSSSKVKHQSSKFQQKSGFEHFSSDISQAVSLCYSIPLLKAS